MGVVEVSVSDGAKGPVRRSRSSGVTGGVHTFAEALASHVRQHRNASADLALFLTISGSLNARISGTLHLCQRGDLLAIPLGEPVPYFSGKEGCQLIVLSFPASLAGWHDLPTTNGHPPHSTPSKRTGLHLLPVARKLWIELWRTGESADLASRGLALQLLAEAVRVPVPPDLNAVPNWITTARARIEEDYATTLRVSDLADQAGVSAMKLIRSFRSCYGTSPGAHLRQVRLDAALRLLEETSYTLSEVALSAGYADQSHLCRVIKRATTLTPGEYRKSSD